MILYSYDSKDKQCIEKTKNCHCIDGRSELVPMCVFSNGYVKGGIIICRHKHLISGGQFVVGFLVEFTHLIPCFLKR